MKVSVDIDLNDFYSEGFNSIEEYIAEKIIINLSEQILNSDSYEQREIINTISKMIFDGKEEIINEKINSLLETKINRSNIGNKVEKISNQITEEKILDLISKKFNFEKIIREEANKVLLERLKLQ